MIPLRSTEGTHASGPLRPLLALAVPIGRSRAGPRSRAAGDRSGRPVRRQHTYKLAQEAYRRADKASRHASGEAYLKQAGIDRKLGDFSAALDDAKKAWKAANGDRGQTLSEDYLLTVESYALSSDDKRTVDESLDRLVFDD